VELFQEQLKSEPFWMLIGCILMNRSKWKSVEPVLGTIRKRWPTPEALAAVPYETLIKVVAPVGIQSRKTLNILEFAEMWVILPPANAEEVYMMPGCGEYASDSWRIFVEENTSVRPSDSILKHYLEKKRSC